MPRARSGGRASPLAKQGGNRGWVETLSDEIAVQLSVLAGVFHQAARPAETTCERPFQQLLFVNLGEYLLHDASRKIASNAKRRQVLADAESPVPLDQRIGPSSGQRGAPVVERTIALESANDLVN